MNRIYLSPPHVGTEERELLLDAFDSNWIAPVGPHVDAFERELCAAVDVPYGVALSSGTAALHLALLAVGVRRGDEVFVSDLTFAATVNAIEYVGARPVFIDSSERTWTLDPDLLGRELERRSQSGRLPAAVIVVDLYGQCGDYHAIRRCCEPYAIPIIEDAAEALGATYAGKPAGSLGDVGVFSFNGNKIITTSGGGMLVSSRADWVDRVRYLATQAREPSPHYEHRSIGYNYRLSNLLAALGRGQLGHLPDRVLRRRQINVRYRQHLGALPGISFMPEAPFGRSTFWLTCILVDPAQSGTDVTTLRRQLEAEDIEARPTWKPMHLQPIFAGMPACGGAVAEHIFRRGLCLPSGSGLTDSEIDKVARVIRANVAPEPQQAGRTMTSGAGPMVGAGQRQNIGSAGA